MKLSKPMNQEKWEFSEIIQMSISIAVFVFMSFVTGYILIQTIIAYGSIFLNGISYLENLIFLLFGWIIGIIGIALIPIDFFLWKNLKSNNYLRNLIITIIMIAVLLYSHDEPMILQLFTPVTILLAILTGLSYYHETKNKRQDL